MSKPITYHWIATVELPGGTRRTHDGTYVARESVLGGSDQQGTRSEAFAEAMAEMRTRYFTKDLTVLLFDLRLNNLLDGGGAR